MIRKLFGRALAEYGNGAPGNGCLVIIMLVIVTPVIISLLAAGVI